MGRKRIERPSEPTDQVAIWMPKAKIDEIIKLKQSEDFKWLEMDNDNSMAGKILTELVISYAEKNNIDVNPHIMRFAKMKARKN